MPLTGKDVWDAIVKLGLMSGLYDPRTNTYCANAEKIAGLLNEVLTKRQSWLSNLIETDEAMRVWEANTSTSCGSTNSSIRSVTRWSESMPRLSAR
jgi:hypothetical protein